MNTMSEEHIVTSLKVAVELPPEKHHAESVVSNIVMSMFEDDDYEVDLMIIRGSRFNVTVHIPMKNNPENETALLRIDNIAGALIMQRLMMSL
jgi:hypothetical protein